jgi:hypothetical protein
MATALGRNTDREDLRDCRRSEEGPGGEPGHRVVIDADDVGDECRRDRCEQPYDGESCEGRQPCDDEYRPHLCGHRQALQPDLPGAAGGFRDSEHSSGGQHNQNDVHHEGRLQRRRFVLHQESGQDRSTA